MSETSDGPVVLYDGVCGMCNGLVQFIARRDRRGRFRFAALQGETGQALLRRHGLRTDDFDTVVLVEGARARTKSRAALRILGGLGGAWGAMGAFSVLPEPLLDFFYDRVANNRYRVFGRSDACMLPPPEMRARFLP